MDCKKSHTAMRKAESQHKCERLDCSVITSNARFCSRTCSNIAEPRRARTTVTKTTICSLDGCNNPLPKNFKKFCSRVCQTKNQWNSPEKIRQWLDGELDASKPAGKGKCNLSGWARNYLMEEAGWKCTQCSWGTPHPLTGKPPLEVDHIDGNRCNNSRENLVVLCPNCHSLTTTYRRYNYRTVQDLKRSDPNFR